MCFYIKYFVQNISSEVNISCLFCKDKQVNNDIPLAKVTR